MDDAIQAQTAEPEISIEQAEKVSIDALRPNEYNPNQQSVHDFNLLVTSMRKDGFTTPILANRDGRIIDGEHRWRAAQVLGMTYVPVVWKDYDEAHLRIATIRHNRARGEHDVDLEAQVLADLEKSIGLQGMEEDLGLNAEEMAISLSRLSNAPALEVLADELIDSTRAGLQEQGLSGEGLETIAKRHAMILAKDQLKAEDVQAVEIEKGKNYRVELVFDNVQGAMVKTAMKRYASPLEFILAVCEYACQHYPEKAGE